MRALQLNADKKLNLIDTPKPEAKEGEVLVKLKAAALNHREIWLTKGLYPGMKLPCILGADGAGVVEALGPNVDSNLLNKEVIIYPALEWGSDQQKPLKQFRVLGMPEAGTLAEYISVSAENVFPKPDYLSWEESAALPVAFLTAWRALVHNGNIQEGQNVLITGIGGGVAQAGLALALAHNANVYVSSSKQEKIDQAIKLGAKGGVNYKDSDWCARLKELSNGIDLVMDSSPPENLDDYLAFLNSSARIVCYGATATRQTNFNISKFFLKHLQFIGSTMGSPKDFADMLSFIEEHKVRPTIAKTFPFEQAIESIKYLESGEQVGKAIVVTNNE